MHGVGIGTTNGWMRHHEERNLMKLSKEVEALLLNQSLCMMATCWEQRPYLSLMKFTFLEDDSRIILSTRQDSSSS